jgi:fluoride exporter
MRQAMEHALYIGVGGFLGANARYFLSLGIGALLGRNFPYGTLIINVSGSFLLAVFLAWVARQVHFEEAVRLLVAVGFFGAYTTFSSFANESLALFQDGNWLAGAVYIGGTNVLCLLGVVPGLWIGSKL